MFHKMLSLSLKLSLVGGIFVLAGCAEYHRRVLENTEPRGDEFTQKLSKEYQGLGETEQKIMYDESSADYYYRKAIASKEGRYVCPTNPEKWDIEPDLLPEFQKARASLMCVLCAGARCVCPALAARAQSHYDCWVEQQSEGWQQTDIADCRTAFYKALKKLEKKLGVVCTEEMKPTPAKVKPPVDECH